MGNTTDTDVTPNRADRSPGPSYVEIIADDLVPAPDFYTQGPVPDIGTEPVAASRYYDPAFLAKELDHVFSRTWQWACREEDIPEVGDYMVFDLGGYSWIIVRSAASTFKALGNACPHRGRQIVETDGHHQRFRCPYHGIQWNLDGTVKHNPFGWDMPQWGARGGDLPEAKVALWGGFVFINMDHNAPPLESVLHPIPEHFTRYDFEGKYKAAHVIKKIRANWKATCEAFMESHHVVGTHPQALPMTGDLNSQYDILSDYVGRQFTAQGVQSPNIERALSKEEILGVTAFNQPNAQQESTAAVPEGLSARAFSAASARRMLEQSTGRDYSQAGDAEMIDSLLYHVFPNLAFWAGMAQNIVYRFRPNGMDPDTALMDILILRPYPKDGPRPKPVPIRYLDFDEPVMMAAAEIGAPLAEVYDQDVENLPWVQKGLRTLPAGVAFSKYMEMRLRRHHQMLDQFIAEGEARPSTM
ncbi:MAG: aromatic ring-hydroxylating dioxygenase subunit alpha [Pseudomonadales bacterium]|nr:aromatic ring-hydroxylating dioxygenase subunit alpha [Pseudomonadales bacterium]